MDISTVSSSSGQSTQSTSIPGPDDRVGELPVSAMVPAAVALPVTHISRNPTSVSPCSAATGTPQSTTAASAQMRASRCTV